MMEASNLRNEIIHNLLNGLSTPTEIAGKLGTSEYEVLSVLDKLRADGIAEFMAGDWSLTETFKGKLATNTGEK